MSFKDFLRELAVEIAAFVAAAAFIVVVAVRYSCLLYTSRCV